MTEIEERADQLSLNDIDSTLADGDIFKSARKKLLDKGAKFLVGPRGTGKTHVMRYTYFHALKNKSAPLPFYASFNRYLNLEPLLKKSPDALKKFHSWVVAKLLISAFECIDDLGEDKFQLTNLDPMYQEGKLKELVSLLERGSGEKSYEDFGQFLTVDHALRAVKFLTQEFSRTRAVLLLDDAALSLSDQYLVSFFEIFRLLKDEKVSPKASVYPGTTQYGPTFHASHEVESISLWLSVEDAEYLSIMGDIADRRLTTEEMGRINPEVLTLFKYISFGMPRVFLRLLREYFQDPKSGGSQQKINKIIENQTDLIGVEYDSLGIKLKQFSSLIVAGRKFFDGVVGDVSKTQRADLSTRNIILGLQKNDERTPLTERMLRFLVEIGMLFPLGNVSHGPNRKYDRYIPHLAFLYQHGAFREGRGSPLNGLATVMGCAASKQPVRRALGTVLSSSELHNLKLDLPPCQNCGAQRLNDSQKFCHECGEELVASSLFEECMKLPLDQVPGVSRALIARIEATTPLRTIAHVYASQDASGELQQAKYVGAVRAEGIIKSIAFTVQEFLS